MTVKLYERKKDAEFVAARVNRIASKPAKVQKIRVINEQAARDVDVRVCPDLGIASHSPKKGETGWIVIRGNLKRTCKEYRSVLEFLRK